MTDYYAPHPRFTIERPLVLVGHPGAGVAAIARMVSGRTGLTFNDVPRAVESRAGRSCARILIEDGVETLRTLEAAALDQAVRRRPHGVVAVGSGALENDAVRAATKSAAHLLWVQRPDEVLLDRIRAAIARAPESVTEFVVSLPTTVEDLSTFLAPRDRVRTESDSILEAADLHPGQVATDLLATLDRMIETTKL